MACCLSFDDIKTTKIFIRSKAFSTIVGVAEMTEFYIICFTYDYNRMNLMRFKINYHKFSFINYNKIYAYSVTQTENIFLCILLIHIDQDSTDCRSDSQQCILVYPS